MAETRCYLIVDGGGYRTPAQWHLLISGLKDKPMCAAIIEKARESTYNTVHINRYSVPNIAGNSQYVLGDFEMREVDRPDLLAVLEAEAIAHGIDTTGLGTREIFRRVLLAEVKEVAVEAGYPQLEPLLNVEIIGFGQREVAIADANAWIAAHSSDWEPIEL